MTDPSFYLIFIQWKRSTDQQNRIEEGVAQEEPEREIYVISGTLVRHGDPSRLVHI